jgi:hypothetical protein
VRCTSLDQTTSLDCPCSTQPQLAGMLSEFIITVFTHRITWFLYFTIYGVYYPMITEPKYLLRSRTSNVSNNLHFNHHNLWYCITCLWTFGHDIMDSIVFKWILQFWNSVLWSYIGKHSTSVDHTSIIVTANRMALLKMLV